jgi:predicted AlkP superfamily pyrophosphatase or phosphodiesterase
MTRLTRRASALLAALAAIALLGALAPAPRQAPKKPVVVLISLDGFRADYITRPGAVRLRELAARGVRAERMLPAFPSKTFPNHYSIVTGLYTEHHGIVANSMFDPELGKFAIGDDPAVRDARWWDGEPIWVTAEKQGVRTAPFLWPGSEAPIGGIRPHWWIKFDNTLPYAERVRRVMAWLTMPSDSAPRFVTAYFSATDDAGHSYGPGAPQTDSAIAKVDSAVGMLMDGITANQLGDQVNLIVVADHGMSQLSSERVIFLDDYIALDDVDIIDWSPVGAIAPKGDKLERVYAALKGKHPHLQVYKKGEVPARLHFNAHKHITPLVAIADDGWTITTHARLARAAANALRGGAHGYDNQLPSMGALFVASGPAFKRGVVVPPFQNVHVYSLIAEILKLKPAKTDGSIDSVRALLR